MNKAKFLTPVITAFTADGQIDQKANTDLWNHILSGGIDGIVLLGSAGEFCSLSHEQKKELVLLAEKEISGKGELIIGTGCMDTEETIEFSNFALAHSADAVMVISPYYFGLTDENVERFYDRVADGINGNMYLYNYPDRTGYHVSSQATLNLLRRHKNIIGYKDSVSDFSHTRELLAMTGTEFPEFMVYSGFDENFVHNLMSGGCGCIGGLSNIYPEVCSAWVKSVNEHDVEKMADLQKLIDKMMVIYSIVSPFMPAVRKALQMRGLEIAEYCPHPIGPVNEEQSAQIKAVLGEVDAYIAEAGL